MDCGSTAATGIHVSCVTQLRRHFGLDGGPVRVLDPGQMLGEVAADLKGVLGIDTEPVLKRGTRLAFRWQTGSHGAWTTAWKFWFPAASTQ